MSYFVDKTDNSFYFHIYNENIDGVKHFNKEEEIEVKDLAELIAEAADL